MLSGTVITWAERARKDGMEEGRIETWPDHIPERRAPRWSSGSLVAT
jgi:hypothetical protein